MINEQKLYSCDECDYKTNEKGHLKRHIESVHEQNKYSCDECDYKAKQKSDIKTRYW